MTPQRVQMQKISWYRTKSASSHAVLRVLMTPQRVWMPEKQLVPHEICQFLCGTKGPNDSSTCMDPEKQLVPHEICQFSCGTKGPNDSSTCMDVEKQLVPHEICQFHAVLRVVMTPQRVQRPKSSWYRMKSTGLMRY